MQRPNWKNRTLFHGDNLDFLRAMNSHSVHLIATDPPFNKGKDFHATPDSLAAGASFQDRWSWEKDVHPDWLEKIRDDYPAVWEVIDAANAVYMRKTKKNLKLPREEVGSYMGAYLCFMAVRLLEMHRVLRHDGSIYLHCDPTASHYLKGLLDAIFGKDNFRNEIVWCYDTGGRAKAYFPKKHDIVLWYSKHSKEYLFNYDEVSLPRDPTTMHEPVLIDKEGKAYQRNIKNGKEYRYYLDKGVLPEDWWVDLPALNPASLKRTGSYTQKPIKLYERIIKASSYPGDIVLDPFCGCATTLIAAERLGRQWVGIDLWDKAHEQVVRRLKQEYLAGPDGQTEEGQFRFDESQVEYSDTPPPRTDDGEEAVPFLLVRERVKEPKDAFPSNEARKEFLRKQYGLKCQGCDRIFDDPRYLELDHNRPRADGGWNHIDNRILLCGPCNRLKSHVYTLSGLRRENSTVRLKVEQYQLLTGLGVFVLQMESRKYLIH